MKFKEIWFKWRLKRWHFELRKQHKWVSFKTANKTFKFSKHNTAQPLDKNKAKKQKCKTGSNKHYFDSEIFLFDKFHSKTKQTSFFCLLLFLLIPRFLLWHVQFFKICGTNNGSLKEKLFATLSPLKKDHLLLRRFVTLFLCVDTQPPVRNSHRSQFEENSRNHSQYVRF